MRKAFVVLGLIFLSLNVSALPGTQWQTIIDRLEANGIRQIGDLKLSEIRRAARRMNWHEIQGPPPSVMSGTRQSGYNLPGNAYLNRETNPNAIAENPVTELHELLEANGFYDTDNSASLALQELSLMPPGAERTHLLKFYAKTFFKKALMRKAGGSSVSGGGDWTISSLKRRVLESIAQSGRVQDSFRAVYARIRFEPISSDLVSLFFEYRIDPFTKKQGAQMIVYFPRDRFVNQDDSLVAEIATKLTQIFPARPGVERVMMQPTACRGTNKQIAFSPTQDSSVQAIQDLMGGFVLGCKSEIEKIPGFTGRSVRTPSNGPAPREVNDFHWDCSMYVNGEGGSASHRTPRGTGMLTYLGTVNDVSASFRVSPEGDLTFFSILPKGGQVILLPVTPGKGATVSRETPLGRVDLSCVYSRN